MCKLLSFLFDSDTFISTCIGLEEVLLSLILHLNHLIYFPNIYIAKRNVYFVLTSWYQHSCACYYEIVYEYYLKWILFKLARRDAFCKQQLIFVHNDLKFENNKLKTLHIRQTRRSIQRYRKGGRYIYDKTKSPYKVCDWKEGRIRHSYRQLC